MESDRQLIEIYAAEQVMAWKRYKSGPDFSTASERSAADGFIVDGASDAPATIWRSKADGWRHWHPLTRPDDDLEVLATFYVRWKIPDHAAVAAAVDAIWRNRKTFRSLAYQPGDYTLAIVQYLTGLEKEASESGKAKTKLTGKPKAEPKAKRSKSKKGEADAVSQEAGSD